METIMYMVGYDKKWLKELNCGWGCGYLMIPDRHPCLPELYSNDGGFEFFHIPDFEQEITLVTTKEVDGKRYMVIGFDLAHSWNGPQHDFNYCLKETMKMKEIIDNYKPKEEAN